MAGKPSRRTSPGRRMEEPRAAELWLRAVFEHSAAGIGRLDRAGRVRDGNAAFQCFFGCSLRDLRGRRITDFVVAEESDTVAALVAAVGAGARQSISTDVRFVRRDGNLAWGALTVSRAAGRRDLGLISVVQDISDRKALEAELLHKAFRDPLTELANRTLFRDRIEHALARNARAPESVAVLMLDLDNFKAVNDTLGHAAGDALLQSIAGSLLGATRGCDTVARLGGDEFGVLLEGVSADDGPEVAAQRIVNALRRPVEPVPGRRVTVGASIGISVRAGAEGTEELLRNADVAMYEAKGRARGRWVVYDSSMHAALVDKVSLEADLRRAIEQCQLGDAPRLERTGAFPRYESAAREAQFTLAYQPIVDVSTQRLIACEALLRWSHPERGDIFPGAFVPLAEETGLILPLGRWALRAACRQAAAWNAARPDAPIAVTVNVSGRQLQDEGLTADVDGALHDAGLDPACLILEMTETVIMQEAATTQERLNALKALGVRLAIDDFGTGYSSLSHLQQFPVDFLKIDRSFVDRMHQGANDAALVRTIIALARLLSLGTIAEGVEDAGQQHQLRELGCDAAQGFIYGEAMGAAAIDAILAGGNLPIRVPMRPDEPAGAPV